MITKNYTFLYGKVIDSIATFVCEDFFINAEKVSIKFIVIGSLAISYNKKGSNNFVILSIAARLF